MKKKSSVDFRRCVRELTKLIVLKWEEISLLCAMRNGGNQNNTFLIDSSNAYCSSFWKYPKTDSNFTLFRFKIKPVSREVDLKATSSRYYLFLSINVLAERGRQI